MPLDKTPQLFLTKKPSKPISTLFRSGLPMLTKQDPEARETPRKIVAWGMEVTGYLSAKGDFLQVEGGGCFQARVDGQVTVERVNVGSSPLDAPHIGRVKSGSSPLDAPRIGQSKGDSSYIPENTGPESQESQQAAKLFEAAEAMRQLGLGEKAAAFEQEATKLLELGGGALPESSGTKGDAKPGETKPKGKLVKPISLKLNPTATQFRVWKQEVEAWYMYMEPDHGPKYTYLELVSGIPEDAKLSFFRLHSAPSRTVPKLLAFLTERYGADEDLEERNELEAYRSCKRNGRNLKDFRLEWLELREVCLASGQLTKQKADVWDLLKAAELSAAQRTSVLDSTKKSKERAEYEGVPFDDLEATLGVLRTMEKAFEHGTSDQSGENRKRKATFDESAMFGKGQQRGRNESKGKGAQQRSWSAPAKGSGKQSGCFNCGSSDHWARDCPRGQKGGQPGGKSGGKFGGWPGGGGKSGGKSGGGGDSAGKNNWKCPNKDCGASVWAKKDACFKCGTKKPGGGGPGGTSK